MNKWFFLLGLVAAFFAWKENSTPSVPGDFKTIAAGDRVRTIVSDGSNFVPELYLEDGVRTVFEFYADW